MKTGSPEISRASRASLIESVAGELDAVGAEGIGLDQLRPGRNVRSVNFLDDFGLSEVELVEGALEADATGMELRAHGAVAEEGTTAEAFEEWVFRAV